MLKNEIVDLILTKNGQSGFGRTVGSSGRKDALTSTITRFGLDVDLAESKPVLAQAIVEAAGLEWRTEYDSRHTASGGGDTVTKPGWVAVNSAVDRLAHSHAQADERALDLFVRGRDAPNDLPPLMTDAARRRRIERHAVELAVAALEDDGWHVEDVGDQASFDLLSTRDQESLHVEVKGTTTAGRNVMLTRNEVANARENRTDLIVVHSIEIQADGSTTGGVLTRFENWTPSEAALEALTFRYEVPDAGN